MIGIGAAVFQALGAAGQMASGIMSAQARQGEFAEQLRQLQRKKDYTLSLTGALSAASGLEAGSLSTTEYLKSMTQEFDTELQLVRNAKKLTHTADMIGLFTGTAGAGAGIYGGLARANNWDGMGMAK